METLYLRETTAESYTEFRRKWAGENGEELVRERLTQGFPRGSDERTKGMPVLCLCSGANLARPVSLGLGPVP